MNTYPENRSGDAAAEQAWDDYAAKLNWMGKQGSRKRWSVPRCVMPACSFMSGELIRNAAFLTKRLQKRLKKALTR